MMRKNHVFRPRLSEILEARAVPSMAGVSVPTGIAGISVTLPAQVSLANPKVQAAFTAFDESYIRAVDTILLAPGPNGLVDPSNNRAAFVTAVERSLTTFAEQLVLSLSATSTGPATSTGSTTSAVANQVVAAIVGGGATSLEGQLLALSASEIEAQVPTTSTTSGVPTQAVVAGVVNTAEQVRATNRVPVADSVGSPSTTTDPTSTASPSSKAGNDVRSAFNAFLNDYFKAVQGVLLAPGANGRVDPPANRVAFDAKVNESLRSLETTLSASLGRYPATSALGPKVQSAVGADGASSLKGQLANLATPEAASASVVRDFTLGSTRAIAQALALIGGDVSKLIGPAGQ